MIEKNGKFYCDKQGRYITEDIFIGMKYLIDIANKYNVSIPKLKKYIYIFLITYKSNIYILIIFKF